MNSIKIKSETADALADFLAEHQPFLKEKLITEQEAVMRVDPAALDQLLHPVFVKASEDKAKKLCTGLPARS